MTAQPQSYFHAQDAHTAVTPCFTPGTMIATLRGERAVETLQQGDKIVTRDNGVQEIAWIGGRILGAQIFSAPQAYAPSFCVRAVWDMDYPCVICWFRPVTAFC